MGERHFVMEEQGPVLVIRLARPEKKNALSFALMEDLTAAARGLSGRTDLKAVVLAGSEGYFTAGMDLADPAGAGLAGASLSEKRAVLAIAPRLCQALEDIPQLTFAAIEGFCIGGGVSLVSALDFRIMAQSSYIRAPEIDWAMNMSWATLPRLLHLIGPARTKELIVFGEAVKAQDAFSWGFAQRLCPDGSALSTALEMARKAAQKPFGPASMTKATVNALATALDRLASHMDADQFLLSVMERDKK
ncbi:MAG: enoyl-CoA hydratase/isomerase family protein [Thermodesulfobacteriota bacterium]